MTRRQSGIAVFLTATLLTSCKGTTTETGPAVRATGNGEQRSPVKNCPTGSGDLSSLLDESMVVDAKTIDDARVACARRSPYGCFVAGVFSSGTGDADHARKYLLQACEWGCAPACGVLGEHLSDSRKDAHRWFEVGCKLGDELSCNNLKNPN